MWSNYTIKAHYHQKLSIDNELFFKPVREATKKKTRQKLKTTLN